MKIWKILLIVLIAACIIFRLLLPHYLLKYVIYRVNQIPEYRVQIADLDVHLYRGSYTLKKINLVKITKHIPAPFFAADTFDLSVQWSALFHGRFLAKIVTEHPVINFVTDPNGKNEQLSIDSQWENAVKALFPANFNQITANDGEINFESFTGKPPFKLSLKNVFMKIDNIDNALHSKEILLSTFVANGQSPGGAAVNIKGKYNPYTKQPTFYLTAELKHMPMSEAGNFLKHYTAVDVTGGNFSLYIELAAEKGKITGYAKPFIKDLKISPGKAHNPLEAIYDGAAVVVSKIVTNHKQDTIATKINLSGNIDDPNTSIFSIIGYIFSHAFIQALVPSVDHDVKMRDVLYGK